MSPEEGGGEVGNLGGAEDMGGGAHFKGGGAEVLGGGAEFIGGGAEFIGGGAEFIGGGVEDRGPVFAEITSVSAVDLRCNTLASCFGARFFFRMCPAVDLARGRTWEESPVGGFWISVLAGNGGAGLEEASSDTEFGRDGFFTRVGL